MAPSFSALGPATTAVVGPLTVDLIDGDRRPGGAVSYAARVAHALGERLAILTIGAADSDRSAFRGHDLALVEDRSLCFEHSGTSSARRLRLIAQPSRPLRASDLPPRWGGVSTLIFAPLLADDVDIASFDAVRGIERRALLAQGLQRCVGREGAVEHLPAPSPLLLPLLTAETSLFLSAEEVRDWDGAALPALVAGCARVVITQGAEGATVYRAGDATLHVEVTPAKVVDTTGAGDVFATAFMLALAAGAGDGAAARLASASAAASIERPGAAEISASDIESRGRPRTTRGAP